MPCVSTHGNFVGATEVAFGACRQVFGAASRMPLQRLSEIHNRSPIFDPPGER